MGETLTSICKKRNEIRGKGNVTRALRSDVNGRFVSTRELWPARKDRKIMFHIEREVDKITFPNRFSKVFANDFPGRMYLIDVKDNCLVLKVCKDNNSMWLPLESLSQIREFYNKGKAIKLGLIYVVGGIFFDAATDDKQKNLERMYKDRYVRDVLPIIMLRRIKEVFKLDYSGLNSSESSIVNPNVIRAQLSTEEHKEGDGVTVVELFVRKSYSKSSRMYIPTHFARFLLPAGEGSAWTINVPSKNGNNTFTFKFIRNRSQTNILRFCGEWRQFCNAYRASLQKPFELKILSVANRIIQ
ncbi:hypothetical protein PIB30_045442, partial [Stylosanthes scabra]|nr:hypothetical protein [Stylosanthes scabra]